MTNQKISDYGFVFSMNKNPTIADESISLGAAANTGSFFYTLDTLNRSSKYYYRAYFMDLKKVVHYGEEKGFYIQYIRVDQISPSQGLKGTTVKILGSNFISDISQLSVKFSNQEAKIVSASDSEISVVVPGNLSGLVKVSIKIVSQTRASDQDFQILPPIATEFFPKVGAPGDTLIIKGKGFSGINKAVTISFSPTNEPLIITTLNTIYVNDTTLKVVVPEMYYWNYKYNVKINIEGKVTTFSEIFSLACWYTLISTSGKAGDWVVFHSNCGWGSEKLTLNFGNNIKVKPFADGHVDNKVMTYSYHVPGGIPPDIKVKVSLEIADLRPALPKEIMNLQ